MIVKTCLLVSDDPDDHIEFSEALYEISDDVVLITVSDIKKALSLLLLRKCIPDFLFVNLDMAGLDPNEFFSGLESDDTLRLIKVVVYGDGGAMPSPRVTFGLGDELTYSELKKALRRVVGVSS